ncbi:hypothetical protein BX600DRAFT_532587 [Xylariales sp. PMI_506]|nr:hypothetical protein BX600DRAFT_532587 [Xylariales sp. PMI_506]
MMRYLALLALVGVIEASAIECPQSFIVEQLVATAVPLSTLGSYNFLLHVVNSLDAPSNATTVCTANPSPVWEALVNISRRPCQDAQYTWAWTISSGADGSSAQTAYLETWHEDASSSASAYGLHNISADQIVWMSRQILGRYQEYVGPQNFSIEASEVMGRA